MIAVRIQAVDEVWIFPNIVEFMSEIGEIVDIWRNLFRIPSDFLQLGRSMKGHFLLCSLHVETRGPCSSPWTIETPSKRVRVREGSVNYVRNTEAGNQLNGRNPS